MFVEGTLAFVIKFMQITPDSVIHWLESTVNQFKKQYLQHLRKLFYVKKFGFYKWSLDGKIWGHKIYILVIKVRTYSREKALWINVQKKMKS